VTNSQTNTTVETKTDENGRVTETTTQIGADGKESTTTVVTANGYTLTTGPDGKITLEDHELGTTTEIEPGSVEETLARTLLSLNPESGDAATAEQDTIVKTVI